MKKGGKSMEKVWKKYGRGREKVWMKYGKSMEKEGCIDNCLVLK